MTLTRLHPHYRDLPYSGRSPDSASFSGQSGVIRYEGFLDCTSSCPQSYQPLEILINAYCCNNNPYLHVIPWTINSTGKRVLKSEAAVWKYNVALQRLELVSEICDDTGELVIDVITLSDYQSRLQTAFNRAVSDDGFTLNQTVFWDLNPEFVCVKPQPCPPGFMIDPVNGYCSYDIKDLPNDWQLIQEVYYYSTYVGNPRRQILYDRIATNLQGQSTLFTTAFNVILNRTSPIKERVSEGTSQAYPPNCGQEYYKTKRISFNTSNGIYDERLVSTTSNSCYIEQFEGCIRRRAYIQSSQDPNYTRILSDSYACERYEPREVPPSNSGCWITDNFYLSSGLGILRRVIIPIPGSKNVEPETPNTLYIGDLALPVGSPVLGNSVKIGTFTKTFIESGCPTDLSYLDELYPPNWFKP